MRHVSGVISTTIADQEAKKGTATFNAQVENLSPGFNRCVPLCAR